MLQSRPQDLLNLPIFFASFLQNTYSVANPDSWQADIAACVAHARPGQLSMLPVYNASFYPIQRAAESPKHSLFSRMNLSPWRQIGMQDMPERQESFVL